MSTHNICFSEEKEKDQYFFIEKKSVLSRAVRLTLYLCSPIRIFSQLILDS